MIMLLVIECESTYVHLYNHWQQFNKSSTKENLFWAQCRYFTVIAWVKLIKEFQFETLSNFVSLEEWKLISHIRDCVKQLLLKS